MNEEGREGVKGGYQVLIMHRIRVITFFSHYSEDMLNWGCTMGANT